VAHPLTSPPPAWFIVSLALAALLGWRGDATAQATPDPTRPPAQLLERRTDPSARGSPGATRGDPEAIVLQAILRDPGGRSRILVDGWLYREGDRVHGARIVSIGQDRVEVDAEGRRSTISLTPGIAPVPRSSPAAEPPAAAASPTSRPPRRAPKEKQ